MRLQTKIFGVLACLGLVIGGCAIKPASGELPAGTVPGEYSLETAAADPNARWWENFEDEQLNSLVETALSDNLTIVGSWARLQQANALAVQAGANLYPDVSYSGGATYLRQRQSNTITGDMSTQRSQNISAGVLASYEVDLWGRVSAGYKAAVSDAEGSLADVHAAAVSIAGEVTTRWINIISQRKQLEVLKKQLATNKTFLELIELRYRKSMAPALDVFQQRQTVAQVEAQIPIVEARERILLNELAVLLGQPPQNAPEIKVSEIPDLVGVPMAGIPAELLSYRPDVRAAQLRLEGSDWRVAVAKADRLPRLSLSGAGSYNGEHFNEVFDNWSTNLAANLVGPIFDAGRRKAEVDRAKGAATERLASYQATVLNAIREVEDALVGEQKQQQNIDAVKRQIEFATAALEQAIERYKKGVVDYLPVLTELERSQALQITLVQRQAELLIFRTNLYRALGGTWVNAIEYKGAQS